MVMEFATFPLGLPLAVATEIFGTRFKDYPWHKE
jgi:hypothetical protein